MGLKPKVTAEEKGEIRSSLHNILTPFIGTLLAFSWTMVVNEILLLFTNKYELPEVAIIISLVYAVTMTIFGIGILIYGKRMLNFIVDHSVSVKEEEDGKKDKDFE